MKTISRKQKIENIKVLAMNDELFMPESISLEAYGQSLTVRPRGRALTTLPCWNEDYDLELADSCTII
jgi:hypothetical protein